ncbi:Ribose transport system permease protein rbsC [Vibrio nigripulchritudo MADA3029]|uniref:Ribose transport system permease protein rbsC n=1 Tax=Vibrio nigripulchritudo TaxID=28173 RepID=U4KGY7_9VIBR|nr:MULTISPECIES: ABC transporter permease [Vibrio]UAB72269.1 ABC transporter permease [Vibrio sp. SCSIO 43132]CCN33625.1 Ribose transport system permease protein rbsC [Vibrio nigripulchritudo AM115]CCN41993.1 Ribose transport system permease protein rbsC [Vibrio nigripulchritudo FTn2]CCN49720.1 Ribose transport system permease protein rbsC [Vibrio nigripulchritudo MADA3020]CCN54009.1 Ribose transport system permease protein rbsC [Vibrio nigripulchritudo MADA3021]
MIKAFFKEYGGILGGLVLLMIVSSFLSEYFLTVNNLTNIVLQTSIVAIVAFGMTYAILLAGIDLSVGSIVALTGLVLVVGLTYGLPFSLMLPVALGVSVLCGFANGFITTWLGVHPFIVTMSFMGIWRGAAMLTSDGQAISLYDNAPFEYVFNGYFLGIPFPIVILIAMIALNHFLLSKTTFGRKVYIVGGNPEAAAYSGINVSKTTIYSYMITGLMAGIGGVMLASRMFSAQPTSANGMELDAIAACVLGGTSLTGGRGTIIGTLIGALIIAVLSNVMSLMNVDFFVSLIVKGIVILIAVGIDVYKNKKG